jgi:hypothetical protein
MPGSEEAEDETRVEGYAEVNPAEARPTGPEEAVATEPQRPEEPVVICEICGPIKGPGAQVYQCQLCMHNFCIKHIDPFFHDDPASRQS